MNTTAMRGCVDSVNKWNTSIDIQELAHVSLFHTLMLTNVCQRVSLFSLLFSSVLSFAFSLCSLGFSLLCLFCLLSLFSTLCCPLLSALFCPSLDPCGSSLSLVLCLFLSLLSPLFPFYSLLIPRNALFSHHAILVTSLVCLITYMPSCCSLVYPHVPSPSLFHHLSIV